MKSATEGDNVKILLTFIEKAEFSRFFLIYIRANRKGGQTKEKEREKMSFVKCREDNIKISEDRLFMREVIETICDIGQKEEPFSILIAKKPGTKKERKKDKKIVCCDCRKSFNFTGGEQHFYEKHDLEEPRRCPVCRERRKREFIESEMRRGR